MFEFKDGTKYQEDKNKSRVVLKGVKVLLSKAENQNGVVSVDYKREK